MTKREEIARNWGFKYRTTKSADFISYRNHPQHKNDDAARICNFGDNVLLYTHDANAALCAELINNTPKM